jgi:glycosyltransferase involved in cell wall biosynthesis
MAAQKPAAGRSPFNPQQLTEWIELERQSFARAAHICTRSHLVRDSIVKDYGLPHHRVTVIGGGVNFMPLPEPIIHDQIDRPTALFIGKELYRKGGDILLRAFAKARAEVPNARLLFLTEDRVPNGLPLDGVELVRPTWDRKVIADLYLRSHVLVLPSRLETWGDVLLEAMSYGLPCIGISGQAMEEVIDHCETGLIIPPEDDTELANALVRLLRDTDLRKAWGLAARRRTESEYTWERVVERASPVFESAVYASKRGRR